MNNKEVLKEKLNNADLFIFDMDGTLLDREDLVYYAYSTTLKNTFDANLDKETYKKYFSGTKTHYGFEKYLDDLNIEEYDIDQLISNSRAIMRDKLTNETDKVVKLKPHVHEFLELIKNNPKTKTVLATSAVKEFVDLIIDHFDLRKYFDLILTAEDVKEGKPNPRIFELPVERLNGKKENSIVFEDALNGIQAAKNAEIFCIGVYHEGWNDGILHEADAVIEDFKECIDLIK